MDRKCPICKENSAMENGLCDRCTDYLYEEEKNGRFSCEEHCVRPTDEPCEEHPADCPIARSFYREQITGKEMVSCLEEEENISSPAIVSVDVNKQEKYPMTVTIKFERVIDIEGIKILSGVVGAITDAQRRIDAGVKEDLSYEHCN